MPPTSLLRVDRLTKRYPGVTAIDDLTLDVPRGLVGLVGANGAGKTTTFRMLLGLTHPTKGTIEVCGIDVADDPIGVRSRLGFMPEHDCLPLDQSAADVVATFGELSGLPARAAPASEPRTSSTSSGSTRRASARSGASPPACANAPSWPRRSSAIRSSSCSTSRPPASTRSGGEEMLALIARLGTFGISVLMATHLLDDVQQVCDHVVMIDAGKLVVAGETDVAAGGHRGGDRGRRRARRDARRRPATLPASWPTLAGHARRGRGRTTTSHLDGLRDVIAELGLPLYELTSRFTSLDDVFLRRAGRAS